MHYAPVHKSSKQSQPQVFLIHIILGAFIPSKCYNWHAAKEGHANNRSCWLYALYSALIRLVHEQYMDQVMDLEVL